MEIGLHDPQNKQEFVKRIYSQLKFSRAIGDNVYLAKIIKQICVKNICLTL